MKVKEIIELLLEFDQEAEFGVVAQNKKHDFIITFGSSEGVTRKSCEEVNLYINEMNSNEN